MVFTLSLVESGMVERTSWNMVPGSSGQEQREAGGRDGGGGGTGVMQSPGSAMNSRGMEREKDVKGPSCTPLFKLSFLSVIVNLLCASIFSPLHRGYFCFVSFFSALWIKKGPHSKPDKSSGGLHGGIKNSRGRKYPQRML